MFNLIFFKDNLCCPPHMYIGMVMDAFIGQFLARGRAYYHPYMHMGPLVGSWMQDPSRKRLISYKHLPYFPR